MANVITLTSVTNGAQADGSSTNQFKIAVTDSSTSAAVANVVVTLSVTSGATLSSTSLTTGSAGTVTGTVVSSTAAAYTITAASSGATSKTLSVQFTSAAETAAANRALTTMQTVLGATTGAGYVGYDGTLTYASGTIGNSFNTATTNITSINNQLSALATATGAGSVGYDQTQTYTSGSVGAAFNTAADNLTSINNQLSALAGATGAGSVGYDQTQTYTSGSVGAAFNTAADNLTSINNQLSTLAATTGAGAVGYDQNLTYSSGTIGNSFNTATTNITSINNQLSALATVTGAGSVGYDQNQTYSSGTIGNSFNTATTNLTSINNQLSALAGATGAGSVGYDASQTYASGTLGSTISSAESSLTTQGDKLARYLDIEDFADDNSAAGDWTTAIQAAIDTAVTSEILEVRGTGKYTISDTIIIRNTFNNGMNLSIHSLSVTSDFPANTTFWDATPMIAIGDLVGNATGVNLFINLLDGGGKADGVTPTGYGFGVSHIHIGSAKNCIAVVRTGDHQWPNASNRITGDFWTENYMGVFLKNGASGTTPIVESWKVEVKFIAANYWAGIWLFSCGQYAQLQGSWDYNGRYLGIIELSSTTGLTDIAGQTGLMLTDGTTPLEFLFYYTEMGNTYAVVAATTDMSVDDGSGTFPWTAGSTISCTTVSGVSLAFSAVTLAADNGTKTNFFDILHDYERAAFGRVQVIAGYLSGVIGGLKYTSNLQYQNAFDGVTDNIHGLSLSHTGTTLAFINTPVESDAYSYVTADFVSFTKKLYMADYLYEGVPVVTTVASSTDAATTLTTLVESTNNKYLSEGTMYDITLKTNFGGTCGSYRVFLVSSGGSYTHVLVSSFTSAAIIVDFVDTDTGVDMTLRQEVQPEMQIVLNIVRI